MSKKKINTIEASNGDLAMWCLQNIGANIAKEKDMYKIISNEFFGDKPIGESYTVSEDEIVNIAEDHTDFLRD